MKNYRLWVGVLLCGCLVTGFCDEGSSFIKDGDRVGFFGDSITAHKIYGELVETVFRHAHPDASVAFLNNGLSGLQLSGTRLERVLQGDPNVITIMIGMNDAINSTWVKGDPIEAKVDQYRRELTALVQGLKQREKVVVLMSPTLTDETVAQSFFRLEGTEVLLQKMGQVCEEVAQQESVYFVPVQSEVEAYELNLSRNALLRPDGVHPNARGHYQIARSLWTHMNLGAPLEGKREIRSSPKILDVDLAPTARLLYGENPQVSFDLTSSLSEAVGIEWSAGAERDELMIHLSKEQVLTLPLPADLDTEKGGTSARMVVEVEHKGVHAFFIVDFFSKAVVHGQDGRVEENISEDGETLATYTFAKEGKGIRFEISVFKEELVHRDNMWPWGRGDTVNLLLDLGDRDALSGLGYDGQVFQFWFTPQEMPLFTPGFLPWAGRHLDKITTAYGERNEKGYTVGVLFAGDINVKEELNLSDRKLIGFDLALNYALDGKRTKGVNMYSYDRQTFIFPGAFTLIDLYGEIEQDQVVTLSIFPGKEITH